MAINFSRSAAAGACALITGACGSNAESNADNSPAAAAQSVAAVPSSGSDNSSCPANGLWAVCSIEKRLKQSGFVAQKTDSVGERRAGFTVTPVAYKLNKSRLELYFYDDAAALQRDISKVDTVTVAPVFIRSANLAALLFTDDGTQAERLSLALTAGAPQR